MAEAIMSASLWTRTSPTRTRRFRTSRRAHVRRASRATPRRTPLLTYMTIKSRLQGFALKLVAQVIARRGHEASDAIGTLHFSHWVPFEENHMGFFTIFDGDFAKYIQDFADKTSFAFDAVFPHVVGGAAHPSREECPGVLSVGIGEQLSADRVLQRLSGPLGARHSSPAGRSQVTTATAAMACRATPPVGRSTAA